MKTNQVQLTNRRSAQIYDRKKLGLVAANGNPFSTPERFMFYGQKFNFPADGIFLVFFFVHTRPAKLPGKCCEHQQKRVELLFKAAPPTRVRKHENLSNSRSSSARMCGFSCLSSLRGTKNFLVYSEDFPLSNE